METMTQVITYELEAARNIRRVAAVRRSLAARVRRCIPCKLRPVRGVLAVRVVIWLDTVTGSFLYDVLKLTALAGLLAVLAQRHL